MTTDFKLVTKHRKERQKTWNHSLEHNKKRQRTQINMVPSPLSFLVMFEIIIPSPLSFFAVFSN